MDVHTIERNLIPKFNDRPCYVFPYSGLAEEGLLGQTPPPIGITPKKPYIKRSIIISNNMNKHFLRLAIVYSIFNVKVLTVWFLLY